LQYFEHQGKPYCETHFHAAQGTMCQSCQKPITGRCVTAIGGKRYHVEHFTCAYCKKQLYNTTYKETGGKYFCQPCHVKLFE
jgi:paxillin